MNVKQEKKWEKLWHKWVKVKFLCVPEKFKKRKRWRFNFVDFERKRNSWIEKRRYQKVWEFCGCFWTQSESTQKIPKFVKLY